jgi:AraC-like DNA-binding protein
MAASKLPEQTILGTLIVPVDRVLQDRGIDPAEILESAEIDPATVEEPDWRIANTAFDRLMRRCVEVTEDETFGLCAAAELQPQVLQGLGLGWLASDSVYDGLRRLVRFCKVLTSIADIHIEETDDLVKLYFLGAMTLTNENFEYATRDYGVGLVVRMCQLNLGDFISPVQIEMARPTPKDPSRWEYMLATHVSFEHDKTCITWSRSDIQKHLATGDPTLARVVDEHAANYIDSYLDSSVSREVAQKIIHRLPDGPPSQTQIADDMCMSNRTLQRKLKDEGISFSDLLQDSRMQLAKKYLRLHHRSVVEVCYLLGFSEPSAFSKAFKRWTGQTPAEYRNEALQL